MIRVFALAIALTTLTTSAGCSRQPKSVPPKHLPGFLADTRSAVWSRTGNTLYYNDRAGNLIQYDFATKHKKSLGQVAMTDISPDGSKLVNLDIEPDSSSPNTKPEHFIVYIKDLRTGEKTTIYRAGEEHVHSVAWLGTDTIAFDVTFFFKDADDAILVFDTKGQKKLQTPGGRLLIAGSGGTSFVYCQLDGSLHVFDVATEKSTPLPHRDNEAVYDWLYLSGKQLVYNAGNSGIKTIDVHTMTIHDLKWKMTGPLARLSPDLKRYWVAHYSEFSSDLCIREVPAYAYRTIKGIEGR